MFIFTILSLVCVSTCIVSSMTVPDGIQQLWFDLTKSFNKDCAVESEANLHEITEMNKMAILTDSKSLKCYMKCLYVRLQFMKPDGQFDAEQMAKKQYYLPLEVARKCSNADSIISEPDLCERSMKMILVYFIIIMQPVRLLYNIIKYRKYYLHLPKSCMCTKTTKDADFQKFYKTLNIPEDSDQEDIRTAYLAMVKRYHPDSTSEEADANKFQEVDHAFKMLMDRIAKRRWQVEDIEEEEDVETKHVTPQHRQYLSNYGVGYGNPFQRQKQYAQSRAMQASENIMKHRIEKTIKDDKAVAVKKNHSHKIKTKYGFDRLVEDLIQEAMSKGQFDNLSGIGKPLPETNSKTPHVDFVTHKLNQILIDNGFKPEWITLQQEIKIDIEVIRKTLLLQRTNFPPCPLSEKEFLSWKNLVEKHKELTADVNRKILKFNLLVPILERQMVLVNLEKEAKKILLTGKTNQNVTEYLEKRKAIKENAEERGTFDSLFGTIFKSLKTII